MRCGRSVSAIGETGQSEAIHSPEECASTVVKLTIPAAWSIAVVCTVAISCWPKVLRTISSPLESGAYRNCRAPPSQRRGSIVPISDFSGLVSSICALANAVASAAIDGLDRCIIRLRSEIKADGARFGTLRPNAVTDRFLGIFRHKALQLRLGLFVLEMGLPGSHEDRGELRPGVR